MKVLMLGWEFPPHISGGLGTACFGLTQGLAHHGVDVLFVVPRARGDEDARFVDLLGANHVVIEDVHEAPARRVVSERVERTWRDETIEVPVRFTALERAEHVRRSFEILAVDSLLQPYLTEREYAVRVHSVRDADVREPEVRVEHEGTVRIQRRVPVETLRHEERYEPGERITRRRVLEFTGAYGDGLMEEVGRYALAVEAVARAHDFDVVHAHDWMSVPAGLAAARASGKPLVVHVHACEHDRSGDRVNTQVKSIEQLGLDGADLVVCVSHYTAGQLERHYTIDRAKLRIVHNALTQREQKEQARVAKTIPEPIVLFLGRVTFQKGPDYFLEAAARVVRVRPEVKFVMSGSGDMLTKMIERAARLGLARNVHFTGFLKGEEVERMYAMADIYVMPSVSEPFGISPLEAMALDTPVIVSRQSGVSEVLRNALKVDFWDVQDLAGKILALLQYPALSRQLMDEGREEVRGMRWEYPAGLVKDVYTELVAIP